MNNEQRITSNHLKGHKVKIFRGAIIVPEVLE
jgi:hypothetical protein